MQLIMKSRQVFLKAFFVCTLLSGCAMEPWVKTYERDILADEIMSFDRDGVSTRYMNHVYESREAARGAEGSSGGGCGCN